jgi:hypothetical protein
MKLSEFKQHLSGLNSLSFSLPNGENVPAHFHITEVGLSMKHFIDCGGTERVDKKINLQLWLDDNDTAHRLSAHKLLSIIQKSEQIIGLPDLDLEVEYQGQTISKYGIRLHENSLALTSTFTDCLAKENCGISDKSEKKKLSLAEITTNDSSCCAPSSKNSTGSKCC